MGIFSIRFSSLRKERELTINKCAELLNCSFMKVVRWEKGTFFPDIPDLINISKLFNVSVSYLVGESDERNINNFYKNKESTVAMINDIDKLSSEQKDLIFSMIKNMKKK